jgi:hypothetical protein
MSVKSRVKRALESVVTFVNISVPGFDLADWTTAPKGTSAHKQRQLVRKHPAPGQETERLSHGKHRQAVTGRTPKQLAEDRAPLRPAAESTAYKFKRRATADKKREYKGEPIKDIRWFEEFKADRRADLEAEVRDRSSDAEYARAKEFGEKHADLDEDFMKYITSPRKKGSKRRKLDAKGRSVKDMLRHARPARRTGSKKAA